MGLLRHGKDVAGAHRFQMREKLFAIGDDYWVNDERGDHAYKVNGKALRIQDTFILEDPHGHEVVKIKERKLRLRGTMKVEREGNTVATIHKHMVGIRDRFDIEMERGPDLKARGNFVDHEYEIKRDGDVVATVSKRWFRPRDTYGIEINRGEDEALILAVTVAIDDLSHD